MDMSFFCLMAQSTRATADHNLKAKSMVKAFLPSSSVLFRVQHRALQTYPASGCLTAGGERSSEMPRRTMFAWLMAQLEFLGPKRGRGFTRLPP
ncbi:hypothetical protein [Burkholderia metallica]|uniref:hypothetical protein n=1 Tax=Burkholderia metallica TaxID=488729 RepID=UPI00131A6590|nr:hypothetical protein [Burkholderia metallica]